MQYFLSLLIGLLSFVVLPHISSVHADVQCTACSCVFGLGKRKRSLVPTEVVHSNPLPATGRQSNLVFYFGQAYN